MWKPSKAWNELIAKGGHSIVRFDVFCGQCNKILGEDVDVEELNGVGLHSYHPMEVFCSFDCARQYEKDKNIQLQTYGWSFFIPDLVIELQNLIEQGKELQEKKSLDKEDNQLRLNI